MAADFGSRDGTSNRIAANHSFPVTMLIILAITGHWIDIKFRLHQELLAFIPLEGHHTGEYMASVVYDVLDEFDIKEKFFCVTTDSASNNLKMVKELSKLLYDRCGIEWDWKTNHIPCLAHIINLVVQKFLKTLAIQSDDDMTNSDINDSDINDDGDSDVDKNGDADSNVDDDDVFDSSSFSTIIGKLRAIAKSIRVSTLRWERFQRCCKAYDIQPMTIPLDIKVRWNSTFRMLHKAIYLRDPIERYVNELKATKLHLTNDEWQQAEVLLMFLLPFQRCTARFECNSSYTEIDYVFFAYDTMYNHIDDVKEKLESSTGIGALPCANYMLKAIKSMETVLKKYYAKTALPTVYGDGMILNPRCKLSLFEEDTWAPTDSAKYSNACKERFLSHYDTGNNGSSTSTAPANNINKRRIENAFPHDPEFQHALTTRSNKRRRSDYDRYIEVPNDPSIPSSLMWWRENHKLYSDLGKMVRDVLPVPASGCAVERQFSVSGRITIWQRNRLSPKVISDSMIYKGALAKTRCPLRDELENVDDIDRLPIDECEGKIPDEWTQAWWLKNLGKTSTIDPNIIDMYRLSDEPMADEEGEEEEEEDLYGSFE